MAGDALRHLAERLQEECLRAGLTVATAESCTGGLVADAITDVPGSSQFFRGGVVAYSNAAKEALLGVAAELIASHGAVSAQVAQAMARGARARFAADVAVAITGVAGPGGGTAAKPVGLTYVAVAGPDALDVRRYVWTGDRISNKEASARVALEMVLTVAAARPGSADAQTAAAADGPTADARPGSADAAGTRKRGRG